MRKDTRQRLTRLLRGERGASMVSVLATLVAVAVIGVVVVPALTKSSDGAQSAQVSSAPPKAQDVAAETLAQTAQTAMATYSASSGNGYAGATPAALNQIEPTLITASTSEAYLASVAATSDSYTVVAEDPLTGDGFTLADNAGAITRTCTPAGRGDCSAGGTW